MTCTKYSPTLLLKVRKIDGKLIFFLQIATPRIIDKGSQRLPVSLIRGVGDRFMKRRWKNRFIAMSF